MTMPTSVYTFGGSASSNSGLFQAELDGAANLDEKREEKTTFFPGDEVFFLLHYDSKVRVISLKDTAGGDIQLIGPVSRTREQQITFQHPADLVDLSYQPAGSPSAKWYGRGSNLYLSGQQLQADMAPCLGDISYPVAFIQYLYRPPSTMTIAKDKDFPIDVVIEWEEKV